MSIASNALGGQSLSDRVNSARYALAGQGLARVVCKATTEELIGPKKKHLDYLLQCTHEPNVSIPTLANLLIERTVNNGSWVVVFKSIITVHHLMCYGNERFSQYLATSNCTFNLTNFMDKSLNGGIEMSTFIRRYAKYLNAKAYSYRVVGADFAKMKRGPNTGTTTTTTTTMVTNTSSSSSSSSSSGNETLRTMSGDKILKTLPILQSQVDCLLEFDAHPRDLNNGVITAAFMLLYRDLIRLFACFNDGIINLLEKFFGFKGKRESRDALELYKKFLIRMDRVGDFLKTAEAVGIDKGEIPDLTRAPSSLLEALEAHCLQLEGKDPLSASAEVKAMRIGHSTSPNTVVTLTKEEQYKKALEEEAEVLNKFEKQKRASSGSSFSSAIVTSSHNPSLLINTGSLSVPGASGVSTSPSSGPSNDPDFNAFLMGDPIETTSTGESKKKVAEDILALFEQNTASINANPVYFQQPTNQLMNNPYLQYHPITGAAVVQTGFGGVQSSNPFASSPAVHHQFGARPMAVSPVGGHSPFSPPGLISGNVNAPNHPGFPGSPAHQFQFGSMSSGGASAAPAGFPAGGLMSNPGGFNGGGPFGNNSNNSNNTSFEPNFDSAFPSTTSTQSNNTTRKLDTNSLLNDFSLI